MKLPKKNLFYTVIGILVLGSVFFCDPRESSAVLVNIGETVTFKFDFTVMTSVMLPLSLPS